MVLSVAERLAQLRESAKIGTGSPAPTLRSIPNPTGIRPSFDGSSSADMWYLSDDPSRGLDKVTSQRENPLLGINSIQFVEGKSENQTAYNILGRVTLRTAVADIFNITVFYRPLDDGRFSLSLKDPSYKVQREGKEKPDYVSDIKINDAVKAQILRHLHYGIKTNREWAEARGIEY